MMDLAIAYGSGAEALARRVAQISGIEVVQTIKKVFPDGEQHVRICGDVRGKEVAVFQSFAFSPDLLLVEYALIVDALRSMGCSRITGVFPYLAYARQDNRFSEGEPLSAKVFAKLIEAAGTDEVYAIDMHLHRFRNMEEVFSIPATNLSAMPLLAEHYMRSSTASRLMIVGPDSESSQWVEKVGRIVGSRCVVLEKERVGDREVKVSGEAKMDCEAALIVDDMVSTGKTLIEVIKKLKGASIGRVDAIVTHALLVEDAYRKLREAGLNSLITTDTVPNMLETVSVAPILAKALMKK